MRNAIVLIAIIAACGSKDDKSSGGGGGRGKTSEPKLLLNKIGKLAKTRFAESSEFPRGTAATLPAGPCCKGPNAKCAADPASFQHDPVWQRLGFSIDEATRFQYSYTGDGKSFTATAVGDPECNGSAETWTLNGSVDSTGNPSINLVAP